MPVWRALMLGVPASGAETVKVAKVRIVRIGV